jgi:hypothetical protein
MREITMSNKMHYLVLATLFVGTVRAEETPAQKKSCDDPVGIWVKNFYNIKAAPYRGNSDDIKDVQAGESTLTYGLNGPTKPWYTKIFSWMPKSKPNFDALYGTNKKFSPGLEEEMDAILVPLVPDGPGVGYPAPIATYGNIKIEDAPRWKQNPFHSFTTFSTIWSHIIGKHIHTKNDCGMQEQQPLTFSELQQKQIEQIKREKKMLDEGSRALDRTSSIMFSAWNANEDAIYNKEDQLSQECPYHFSAQSPCGELANTLRQLKQENELLQKNKTRINNMMSTLHKRETMLNENLKDIEAVWTKD